ncbi:MAG: class I SAM-dependent methyltransferase [Acidimicrobiia bacterium]
MEREPRLVFGEVAERYDRARPTYPGELVGDVAVVLGLPAWARVLEIGSGTGKATVLWADAGYEVVCLEPSEEMAAVARANLAGHENIVIEPVGLEEWPVAPEAFDLVTAAQAWHWIPVEVAMPTAHAALRPGGGVALIWNWESEQPHALESEFDEAYRTIAPTLMKEPLKERIGSTIMEQLDESPLFGPVTVRRYPWERTFTAAAYVDLLSTHSDHRMLDEEDSARLHDAITAIIDGNGGELVISYTTEVQIAARA